MGLFVEFDVVDDFGYLDETEEYGIVPDYGPGCDLFVEVFLYVANSMVPVDTGYLKSTLTANTDGNTYCYAETDCEYAQYPEFGTWCQAAQPYFTPALEEALLAAQPLWDQAEADALMEEQLLMEEEAMEEQAQALAQQQSAANGQMQQQMGAGGINWSSPSAFIGNVLAMFVVAFVITTVQAMFGKDFSAKEDRISKAGGMGSGGVYMPDIIIT